MANEAEEISPPVYNVNHMTLGAGPTEILVSVGQSRFVFQPHVDSKTAPQIVVEWLATLSLSRVVAQQLVDSLQNALKMAQEHEMKQAESSESPAS